MKYGFYVLLALTIAFGFAVAHLTYIAWVEPSQPYIIADTDVPSQCCPVGFEPVEVTGKAPELGERMMISCSVPEVYAPYIHYPEGWESSIFNPNARQGQVTKWSLYGLLAAVVGLLAWRIAVIIRKKRTGGKA